MPVTGSIPRAVRILDVLATAPEGMALAEIVARSGFTKTTTFRVLATLTEARLVEQDPRGRSYRLGRKLSDLARTAAHADIAALGAHACKRLAALSEDTVFLSVPEGALSICVLRKTGAFPVRTLTLDQGDARPLGVGAGSLALYAAMSPARRHAVCRVNRGWLAEYGLDEIRLEAEVQSCRARGFALNRGQVIEGISAVAVPVLSPGGDLVAALAIGAIDARMSDARIERELAPALKREAAALSGRLQDREDRLHA